VFTIINIRAKSKQIMPVKGNNINSLNPGSLVSIGQAADLLGVSVDTMRRWDKAGVLRSVRPDGKNRFFDLKSIEKHRQDKPLKISEAAAFLKVSQSTLRRLEKRGLLTPGRNEHDERVYTRADLAALGSGGVLNTLVSPVSVEPQDTITTQEVAQTDNIQGKINAPLPITSKDYGSCVFIWFISVYSILNGISQSLFTNYMHTITFKPYIIPMYTIQTFLIVFGTVLLLARAGGKKFRILSYRPKRGAF